MDFFSVIKGTGVPVIFLHGFCENHELWQKFQEQLSSDLKTISVDLPGTGNYGSLPDNFTIEDIAIQLKKWLDNNNIGECIMIGHSLGGYITLAFAELYGDQLKGFGLFHSSAFADSPEKKENRDKTIQFVKENGVVPFIQTLIPSLFYEGRKEELKDYITKQKEIGNQTPQNTVMGYLKAMRDRKDRLSVLENFQKPIMMIIGKEDKAVPYEKSIEQVLKIKQPFVLELEKTGHMGMFEREKETLAFVKEFIIKCK